MADDTDYRDLLNQPLGDFPDRPSLPPQRNFYGKLVGVSSGVTTQKGTPFLRFDVRLTDAGKDVRADELAAITAAGFSLADYDVWSEFYLTKNAMPMLRGFLNSLGFNANEQTFVELLGLDRQTGEPTQNSQDIVRGLDVIARTGEKGDNGRVYGRLANLAGKRD